MRGMREGNPRRSNRDEFNGVYAPCFDFLLGKTPGILNEPLHVTLRRREDKFVAFENCQAGIEGLQDVA